MNLTKLQKETSVKFNDKNLLENVFIHRSYLNEVKDKDLEHNERLEFLGDAVMELVVTEYLYQNYPDPEGVLTSWRAALVKGETISKVARGLGFNDLLKLSKGEQNSAGKARSLILANTFEAFVGALYLDQGYDVAQEFISKYLIAQLPKMLEKKLHIDPKSELQELLQVKYSMTPSYEVVNEKGPDHDRQFEVAVLNGKDIVAKGTGRSKQKAEMSAAKKALIVLKKEGI